MLRPIASGPLLEEIHRLLIYHPNTGEWEWNNYSFRRKKVGTIDFSRRGGGRKYIQFQGRSYSAARLAWFWMTGNWPERDIDHIDKDSLNDKWSNLRELTHKENCQ
jgi:hypothetical protein